jgi:DNA-binding SARP family transcriptional activator
MISADRISFRLLGPLEVWRSGERIEVGQRRPRVILGVLLLEAGRMVSLDRLTELSWYGQEPPRTARNSIQVCISTLRGALGETAPVVKSGGGYRIDVDRQLVDAHKFRDLVAKARDLGRERCVAVLREAAALWRGPILSGTFSDELRHQLTTGLDAERLAAIEMRIEAELTLGNQNAIIGELSDLASANPHRERLIGLYMLALYRDGQITRSLEVYREFRDRLDRELGLDPGPKLRDLEVSILQHSPDLITASTIFAS